MENRMLQLNSGQYMSGQKFSEPLYPSRVIHNARINGLSVEDYVNSQPPELRDEFVADIQNHRQRQAESDLGYLRSSYRKRFSDPSEIPLFPDRASDRYNAGSYAAIADQGPTIEELEAGSQSPVLSTASTPQDPLVTNPKFIQMAETFGRTPEEHLAKLEPRIVEAARQILLGVEPEPPAPVLQTAVDPADRAGEEPGVLMRNEQNLVQENIGERQLLETRIADLEGSVDTQADVARLQQMKQRLVELGGSVESNPSTSQYDAAAQAYLGQLRGQREQAAAVAPDVRAAEAEIASTTGLLSSGTLPPEMMASVQARKEAAEAALASGNAARDARVADVSGSTLSVDNPVNGMTAQSLGVQLPGQEPGMNGASDYTRPPPVPVDNSGMPSGLGPYTAPTPPTPILAGNEPGMNGASDYSKPVLINTTTPTAAQTPALSTTATRAPALSRGAGNMTANARGSALGMIPRGEALIRIGAAGYSGALQGDGIGAAGREYGSIQDANRKAEVDAYNKAETTRIAELRARGSGKGKSGNLAGPPTAVYKQATLSAITRIKDLLASESDFNPFDNLTGWTGSLLSSVPGTPAHDVLNSINTIEAAVGFDRLQKMRDDSPTGGALGQVTERELALLSQSLGSLKQSSSREQFVANLEAVEKHYQAAVAAVEAQQAEWYRMNGGTMPAKPTAAPSNTGSSNMSAADAIVGI
jgi:hypothetical protein